MQSIGAKMRRGALTRPHLTQRESPRAEAGESVCIRVIGMKWNTRRICRR